MVPLRSLSLRDKLRLWRLRRRISRAPLVYRRGGPGLLGVIYFFVGAFVAGGHNYLDAASDIGDIVSGVLGIILWPLILLGINLHL